MKMNFPLHLMTFNSLLYLHIISLPAAQNQENLARQHEHQSYPGLASSPSAPVIGDNPPYRNQPLPRGTIIPQQTYAYQQQPPVYDDQQWEHGGYLSIGAQPTDQHLIHPQSLPTHLSLAPAHNPHHRRTRSRSMDESNFDNQPSTEDELRKKMDKQDPAATPEYALQILKSDRAKAEAHWTKLVDIMKKKEEDLTEQLTTARKKSLSTDSPTGKSSFFGSIKNAIKGSEQVAIEKRQKDQRSYEDGIRPINHSILRQAALCALVGEKIEEYAKRMALSPEGDH